MRRALIIGLMALSAATALSEGGTAIATEGLCQGEHVLHEVRTFLMESPRRFGPRVAELGLGAVVVGLEPERAEGAPGWCRVDYEGAVGFVHAQSFSPGPVLRPGQAEGRASVDRDTVQLAARGFSPEIEERSRKDNPELDYELVDAVEAARPFPDKIERFAAEGSLDLGGEG